MSDRADPRDAFIAAMRACVTGVAVLTTDGPGGLFALTVGSMASVSADPPLLSVGVARRSPVARAARANAAFALSVLSAGQSALADTFAGRPAAGRAYDLRAARWDAGPAIGLPLLAGATARFECELAAAVDAGSHVVLLGAVRAAQQGSAPALAYTRRAYAALVPLAGAGRLAA